jgi:thioredoxin reductase (NADPH)
MKKHTKVLIIGSGPAGYTASIYAARSNLQPIQVLGIQPGGQLMLTTDIENYPGFEDPVQGPWLMEQMRNQALKVGTEMIEDEVVSIKIEDRSFECLTENGVTIMADTIILSTGAQARWLNVPGEQRYRGFGVSACATCDGFFFKNKHVAVIGGGNSAVEEAIYLTHHASHVTLIHRRDHLRAEKIAQDRLFKNPKISVLWNYRVEEILGTDKPRSVTHLKLNHVENAEEKILPVDGVFVAIGHTPMSQLVKGMVDLDEEGYVITKPGRTTTSVPGIFAAGDVQDKVFRQAITAAGQGCMAALEVEKFLNH